MSVFLLASTSFFPHLVYSINFLWRRLHHFCSYSAYLELSWYFFFYDVYLHCISDLRMFIVPILTWSIRNTVSVHWKLFFIVLPQFTKKHLVGGFKVKTSRTWATKPITTGLGLLSFGFNGWIVTFLLSHSRQLLETLIKLLTILGSGCGSVGRAVAPTRGPWFESSHRQTFKLNILFTVNSIE